jgi:putative Ca2+/H+ antiporter (TMEM165/GDT1 family)
MTDVALWYGFSLLGVWAVSILLAFALCRLFKRGGPVYLRHALLLSRLPMTLLAAAGTFAFSRQMGCFIFTWPAILFAGFMTVLDLTVAQEQKPAEERKDALVRVCVLVFLAECAAYYLACDRLSTPAGWGFLVGLLPAWPLAVRAARAGLAAKGVWEVLFWDFVAFSCHFWLSGAFTVWKTHL